MLVNRGVQNSAMETRERMIVETFAGVVGTTLLLAWSSETFMPFDVADDEYPKEWIYGQDGQPCCTAFVAIHGAGLFAIATEAA